MRNRINEVLRKLDCKKEVQVRTLHSFFLSILKAFGVTAEPISNAERSRMVRQACKDANFVLKNDDLLLIDNMLSFQVNNLMTDDELLESPANTLDELSVDTYRLIRKGYAAQKSKKGMIDYDDMQSYLYAWIVKWAESEDERQRHIAKDVKNYCKAMYNNFYIDEAQDVSKLQFKIIRAMIESDKPGVLDKELVFIGDDDQCIFEGSLIMVEDGYRKIENIQVGDIIKSATYNGETVNTRVNKVNSRFIRENLGILETATGKRIVGTLGHTFFVKGNLNELCEQHFTEYGYNTRKLGDIQVGDYVPVYHNGKVIDDKVVRIAVNEFEGNVYDLEVPASHNFIVNNIVVHNCIYTWRGSDSSIILTLGSEFNIPNYVLSTNYRCKEEILKYASTGIKFNNGRFDKEMIASKNGGNVKIAISSNKDLSAISNIAINQIKKWISNGVKADDIAVLSRNNFHQAILNNMLLREGIYTNSTNDMKFTTSYIYEDVKDLLNIMQGNWSSKVTSKMIWRLVRFFGTANAGAFAKIQEASALSFKQIVGYCVKNFIDRDIEFNDKLVINTKADEQLENIIKRLSMDSRNDMKAVYLSLNSDDILDGIWGLMTLYRTATKFMYKSEDKTRTLNGFLNYFYIMVKSDGIDRTMDFLRISEQLENGNMAIPGGKVNLCTMHGAKGKQWEKVIMFACDNISQPSVDGIVKMIKDGIAVRDIAESISEERRLFYVGNTRAIDELFVITYEEPSIFMLEAMGILENTIHNNYDIIETAQTSGWFDEYRHKFNTEVQSKYNAEV